jgi:hypothetical protein
VKALAIFISYNFNHCLKPNDVFEHVDWGSIAPGIIFLCSRTIILNDLLWRPFIVLPVLYLQGISLFPVYPFLIYGDS